MLENEEPHYIEQVDYGHLSHFAVILVSNLLIWQIPIGRYRLLLLGIQIKQLGLDKNVTWVEFLLLSTWIQCPVVAFSNNIAISNFVVANVFMAPTQKLLKINKDLYAVTDKNLGRSSKDENEDRY